MLEECRSWANATSVAPCSCTPLPQHRSSHSRGDFRQSITVATDTPVCLAMCLPVGRCRRSVAISLAKSAVSCLGLVFARDVRSAIPAGDRLGQAARPARHLLSRQRRQRAFLRMISLKWFDVTFECRSVVDAKNNASNRIELRHRFGVLVKASSSCYATDGYIYTKILS